MSEKDKKRGFRHPVGSSTDFIRGANENPAPALISGGKAAMGLSIVGGQEDKHAYSLADAYVESGNPRIKVVFQVRMTEPLHLKLKYLADNMPNESMHSIALNAIEEKANSLIEEMEKARRQ